MFGPFLDLILLIQPLLFHDHELDLFFLRLESSRCDSNAHSCAPGITYPAWRWCQQFLQHLQCKFSLKSFLKGLLLPPKKIFALIELLCSIESFFFFLPKTLLVTKTFHNLSIKIKMHFLTKCVFAPFYWDEKINVDYILWMQYKDKGSNMCQFSVSQKGDQENIRQVTFNFVAFIQYQFSKLLSIGQEENDIVMQTFLQRKWCKITTH